MYDFALLLKSFKLRSGQHATPEKGLCAMEAVAWLEGLLHSDRPNCTCPIIAECITPLNDWMDETTRQKLIPYLPKLAGTVSKAHEWERTEYAVVYASSVSLPLVAPRMGLDPLALQPAGTLAEAAKAIARAHGHIIWQGLYTSREAVRLAPFTASLKASLDANDKIGMAGSSAAIVVVTANILEDFSSCFVFLDGLLAIGPRFGFSSDVAERAHAYNRLM